jgi:hypothetical protein
VVVGLVTFLTIADRNGTEDTGSDRAATASDRPGPHATSPVTMPTLALSDRSATVCRALLSQLPDHIREVAQRPVTAGAEQNAAYGDPPITLACGIAMPSLPPTDLVYPLNGVCWHAADSAEATVWTTVDREVPVRVTVPKAYDEPGQWTIAFSGPVLATVPSASTIPSGCGG